MFFPLLVSDLPAISYQQLFLRICNTYVYAFMCIYDYIYTYKLLRTGLCEEEPGLNKSDKRVSDKNCSQIMKS